MTGEVTPRHHIDSPRPYSNKPGLLVAEKATRKEKYGSPKHDTVLL